MKLGVSGPPLRVSVTPYDMTREDPYLLYRDMDFEVITRKEGDSKARVEVRLDEILESCYIIEQCLDQIPNGPIMAEGVPKKIKPEPGEAYYRVEDHRGEMGFFVVSDGSDKPVKVKARVPSTPTSRPFPCSWGGIHGPLARDHGRHLRRADARSTS